MAEIDVEIDDFGNSVIHEPTGESFPTRIVRWAELSPHQVADLDRWRFDWPKEAAEGPGEVASLLVEGRDPIEGLIASEIRKGFFFVNLIESAPQNLGRKKLFRGVPGNLFAFVCARSIALGFEGFVSFDAKTELIEHFKATLGAGRVEQSDDYRHTERPPTGGTIQEEVRPMAVVADFDGLDLWVKPHHLTSEEEQELQRFLQEYRERHPLSDSENEALQALVRSLRSQQKPRIESEVMPAFVGSSGSAMGNCSVKESEPRPSTQRWRDGFSNGAIRLDLGKC